MAVRTVAEQKRRMARGAVAYDFCIEISVHVGCRNKVLLEFSTQSFIQAGKDEFGILSVGLLASKGALQHRSDECGRNAVAGDVCDENAELAAIEREEIIEIAGDRAHREIASGDLQASDVGYCARENRGLDLACDFELFVDGQQAMLIGEGAVGGHIAKAADEKQEAECFGVRSVQQAKAAEVTVEHSGTKDQKA